MKILFNLLIILCLPIVGLGSNQKFNNQNKGVLVFSGAGVAGVSYSGVLSAYEKINGSITDSVSVVAGTSAGSIAAGMVALGYTSKDIDSILSDLDFKQFLDPYGEKIKTSDYFHIFTNVAGMYGFYDGEMLHQFLKGLVAKKLGEGKEEATLAEVREIMGKQIYIFVTNISTGSYEVFSSEDDRTKDIPLATAMHTSSNIPLFWQADFYAEKSDKLEYIDMNDVANVTRKDITAYVDGGTVMNYPILYMKSKFPNNDILGFIITTPDMIEWFRNGGNKPKDINSSKIVHPGIILDYIPKLIYTLTDSQYATFVQNSQVLDSTVFIDRKGVSATKFDLTEQDKINLKISGCNATMEFYNNTDTEFCENAVNKNTNLKQNKKTLYNYLLDKSKNYVTSDNYKSKVNRLEQYYI